MSYVADVTNYHDLDEIDQSRDSSLHLNFLYAQASHFRDFLYGQEGHHSPHLLVVPVPEDGLGAASMVY